MTKTHKYKACAKCVRNVVHEDLLKACKGTRNLLDDSLLKWKTDYYLPVASIGLFEKHLDEIIAVIEKAEGGGMMKIIRKIPDGEHFIERPHTNAL